MKRFAIALAALVMSVAVDGAESEVAAPLSKPTSFETQKSQAESGDAIAQTLLGEMYAAGLGVHKDDAEAAAWYRKAADQGYARAQLALGIEYLLGRGVRKDDAQAVVWYRKAADQGMAAAQFNLGIAYSNGQGVKKDDAEAAAWYRKAADQGFAPALSRMAGGAVVPDVPIKALYVPSPGDMYPAAAKQEHQEGVVRVKVCVNKANELTSVDLGASSGFPLLDEAGVLIAKGGRYQAATKAGALLATCSLLPIAFSLTNPAVPQQASASRSSELTELFNKLSARAAAGSAAAQYNLGMFYVDGIGTEKNPALALPWFERAAQGGDPLASYKVGCYYAGQFPGVVPPDAAKALNAKLVAAKAGYALAQLDVARLYSEQNLYEDVATWVMAVAEQGSLQSYVELAGYYQSGKAVRRDAAKAYEYLQIAVRHLPESRAKLLQPQLDVLRKELSDSAAQAAEKAAAEWVAKPTELTIRAQQGMLEARRIVQ